MKRQILLKNFKNILLYKIYKFIGKCDYPIDILPKINFKGLIDFDMLLASNNKIFLIRKSSKSFSETFAVLDGDYILKTDAIETNRVARLSLNLLGSFFIPDYLKFKIDHRSSAHSRWNENQKIYISDHFKHYTKENVSCQIFMHANEIDGCDFPYKHPYSKDSIQKIEEFQKIVDCGKIVPIVDPKNKNKYYEVSGFVKLEHDPLLLNYWHTELVTYTFTKTDEVKKSTSNWQTQYFESVINHILKANSYPQIPIDVKIDNHHYLKSS